MLSHGALILQPLSITSTERWVQFLFVGFDFATFISNFNLYRTALVEHGAILQWHAASFQFSPASLSAIAERQLASDFKPPAENSLVFFLLFFPWSIT